MRKLKIFLLIAAACSVLVASVAYAVPQTRYNFNVIDEDGAAVGAVIVQVYNPGTTVAATLYSDYNGENSTTATITTTTGDVSFYGGHTTYDLVIYDTPLNVRIVKLAVTPLTRRVIFPLLAASTIKVRDTFTNKTTVALTTLDAGRIISNVGAVAAATFTLPAASASASGSTIGLVYDFVQGDTDAIKVVAAGSDTILGTTNNSYVSDNVLGGALKIVGTSATQWAVLVKESTWTDTTSLP